MQARYLTILIILISLSFLTVESHDWNYRWGRIGKRFKLKNIESRQNSNEVINH